VKPLLPRTTDETAACPGADQHISLWAYNDIGSGNNCHLQKQSLSCDLSNDVRNILQSGLSKNSMHINRFICILLSQEIHITAPVTKSQILLNQQKPLLILGYLRDQLLIFIQISISYTVWMFENFPTFRRYKLLSS
jgi:hypothetical protein